MVNYNKKWIGAQCRPGVTLIEITVVIVVLFTLISLSIFSINGYKEWELASEASRKVRSVYNAQRTFLAENPTTNVATLTAAQILPYLSDKSSTLPTVEGADGNTYTIQVNVSPPVITDGSNIYDPSGDPDDGLWDVGG